MSSCSKTIKVGGKKGNNHHLAEFPYLPIPIVTDILTRLGIKTLFKCCLVCKTWADLISTPQFAKLHLLRSPTRCLIKCFNEKRFHLIDPEYPYSLSNKLVFIPEINLPDVPLALIDSCNGLVCLCQLLSRDYVYTCSIFVCNPVLREYITLPKPPNVELICSNSCAFGFSHITNQYKVVLSSGFKPNHRADIYTLGEGSWRSIENVPYHVQSNKYNAFLNGAIHWIDPNLVSPRICCFDFVSEEFCSVPEPSEFDQLENCWSYKMHVGVINDNLSVCDFNYIVNDRLIIWVMKDYGVRESWSKDFVITHKIYDTDWEKYEPIMVNGNGEILVIFKNDSILLYDPKSEAFESDMKIYGVRSDFKAIGHVPSLISLKNVAKGENLKVLGSN